MTLIFWYSHLYSKTTQQAYSCSDSFFKKFLNVQNQKRPVVGDFQSWLAMITCVYSREVSLIIIFATIVFYSTLYGPKLSAKQEVRIVTARCWFVLKTVLFTHSITSLWVYKSITLWNFFLYLQLIFKLCYLLWHGWIWTL